MAPPVDVVIGGYTVVPEPAAGRALLSVGIAYETQIWIFRGGFFVVPVVVYLVAGRIARELQAAERLSD